MNGSSSTKKLEPGGPQHRSARIVVVRKSVSAIGRRARALNRTLSRSGAILTGSDACTCSPLLSRKETGVGELHNILSVRYAQKSGAFAFHHNAFCGS